MAEAEKEVEAKQVIKQIGEQLAAHKTCPRKDTLVKLLKQATSAFPVLKQSESLHSVVKPLSGSLIRHGLLHHKDKDVILLVGTCLCEILRVLAPNPGFSDAVLRDIFKLLLCMFRELDDVGSPYFLRRAKSLDTVAKLQFCELMLDRCEDLVLKMFKNFFSVVRDDHPQSVINSMLSIITCILEEKVKELNSDTLCISGTTLEPFLDVVLQNIIRERKGTPPASYRLAVSAMQNCSAALEHCICQFLTSCILNRDAIESVVKESYHEIILEIFQISPQMVLSVIPHLARELLTDQVDVRIKAVNLIRRLLSLPGQDVAREYHYVFVELLNRFSDKSAEVRLAALSCAKALCMTYPSGRESLEILSAAQGRILDHDDKVRAEAVSVVCELAKTNLNFATTNLISQAGERLRDKKVSVRNKALKKLVELYQEYCTRCAADSMLVNEHIEEIPCKLLMLCYEKDCQDFRPQAMELVLADLFPASLPIEERTRHWIFMFSLFKPPHLRALKIILSLKRRLQDGMQDFLNLSNRSEENGSREAERKMDALVAKMSSCFPDPTKAKDCFQKLYELKASGVFNVLQQFLRKEITPDSETTKDVLLKELGGQTALSEFLHLLATKCSFNIFSSKHVHHILDHLNSDEAGPKHLKDYWVQLLLTIISAFPSLLRGSEKQFQLLLLEREIPFTEQLIEMLARDGKHMSIKLSDVYSSLEKVCLEGTRMQSKLAVSAIAALTDTSEQFIFSKLCKTLVDSLCKGQNVPTVLQSIGCLAQHSISTFEAQEQVITHYILEDIFQQNDAIDSLADETSKSCSSCESKVFGLKALVRSFLPQKRTHVSRPVSLLLDIIRQILLKGGFPSGCACEQDKDFIRLAAAKSVLRLSRKWDLHISPQIFHLTMFVAKDQSPWIRRSFASKLHKLLKDHMVPIRYACAFSFFASDPLSDLQNEALNYLGEFIRDYRRGAQIHETLGMQGAADHPVQLVAFLIHVLAHDSDFPSPECQDERTYAQFLSPLFFTLQALVNHNLVDDNLDIISEASSYLRSIFSAIKRSEDVIDAQMTPKLHLLAEVGISILNSLNTTDKSVLRTSGIVLLPSSLYKIGPAEMKLANNNNMIGCSADASFIKKLVSRLKIEIGVTVNIHNGQFHEIPLRLNGTRSSRSQLKSSSTDNLLMKKTEVQIDKLCPRQKEQHDTSHPEPDAIKRQKEITSFNRDSVRLHNEKSKSSSTDNLLMKKTEEQIDKLFTRQKEQHETSHPEPDARGRKKEITSFDSYSVRLRNGNSKSSSTDNLLMKKTKEQIDKLCKRQKEQRGTSHPEPDAKGRQKEIMSYGRDSVRLCNEPYAVNIHGRDDYKELESSPSFSCDSVATKPFLSENKVGASSKEERRVTRGSKSSLLGSAGLMNHRSSQTMGGNGEALIGKHIKLWSPIERCFCSGVIDKYNSADRTHQITYDSGEIDILSLDSEKWEIDSDSLQKSLDCDSSASGQSKILDAFGYDSTQENLLKNKDLSVRKVPQAGKRKKGCKHAIDTSISDITDTNIDAVARRTRRHKV